MPFPSMKTSVAHLPGRYLQAAAVLLAASWSVGTLGSVAAGPVVCSTVKDPAHSAAVAAAEAWRAARWAQTGRIWSTAYEIKLAPAMPLGIGSFGKTEQLSGGAPPTAPIAGIATIATVACTTYELGPNQAFVVRFAARGLRFNENGQGWSAPLRQAVVHALEVRPGASNAAASPAWEIVEMPEARTALMPGTRLSRPTPEQIAAANKPAKAASRR